MQKLKRCPFCGAEAMIEKVGCGGSVTKSKYIARCTGCKVRDMKQYDDETAARDAWNRRADDERI